MHSHTYYYYYEYVFFTRRTAYRDSTQSRHLYASRPQAEQMLQRAVVRVHRLPQRRSLRGRGAAPPVSSAAHRWRRAVAHARGERRAGARRDLANLRLVGVGVRAGIRASLRARVGVRVRVRVGVGLGLGLGLES